MMKIFKRKTALLLALLAVLSLTLSACGGISSKDAQYTAGQVIKLIEDERYGNIALLMHPDDPKSADEIEEYIEGIEARENVDFSSGIEKEKGFNFSSSVYDTRVDGSLFEIEYDIIVSGKHFDLELHIVDSDAGYGIYDFSIEADD